MSHAWFHVSQLNAGAVALPPAEAAHAALSRRLRLGDEVTLFDGAGCWAPGVVLEVSRGRAAGVTVQVHRIAREAPPARPLTLISAACKGPRLEWLVEKCTELGVWSIILTDFARSIVRLPPSSAPRLMRTALEACKQARRAWLPQIHCGLTLDDALAQMNAEPGGPPLLLVAHPASHAAPLTLPQALADAAAPRHVQVVIGPEGGLDEDEVQRLLTRGGVRIALARHILRVETAAACAAAQHCAWAALLAESPPIV